MNLQIPSSITEKLTTMARRQANINTEQDAVQYLATLATVQIASRAQMPSYTTMVQHFQEFCSCQWQSTCWITTCRCLVPMMATMKQVSPCKVLARFVKHGNLSSFPTFLKEVNLAIGKSQEDTTRLLQTPQSRRSRLIGLVLSITPRTSKKKNELPAARIYRQYNPKAIEVAFLIIPATEFADDQYQ